MHYDMFKGGGVFAYSGGRKIDIGPNATPECGQNYKKCKTVVIPPPPTLWQLVTQGVESGLKSLHIPILGVLGWFAVFWFQNGAIVSWAAGAIPAPRMSEKRLYNVVENLSIQVGQPMPKLEIIESEAMNAFASGLSPDKSMIAVTRGLLDKLDDRELQAVMAHEYTHILNGDSRVMLVAAVFIGVYENQFQYFLSGITGANETNSVQRAANLPARIVIGTILFAPIYLSLALCWVPSMLGRANCHDRASFWQTQVPSS